MEHALVLVVLIVEEFGAIVSFSDATILNFLFLNISYLISKFSRMKEAA